MPENIFILKNNTPEIHFGNLKSRKYAVSVKYFDGDNADPEKRIDYDSMINITANDNTWLLTIYKDNFWFDGHEPDLISEMIADELSKTIYPVQARIDEKGRFLGITNYRHIVNSRWHLNKMKATQKYTTAAAKSFYDAFEKNLDSLSIFEKSMQYDWFWNLLFHPKYIDYGSGHCVKTDLYFAVVPYEYPIQFTGIQTICTEITNYHSVEIHFKSDEIKAHPYFVSENHKSAGSDIYMRLNVFYDMDVFYLFPMHIRAYFDIYSKNSDGRDIIIKRTEFAQYQQNTESNKAAPPEKRSPFLVYDEDEDEDREIYRSYDGKDYNYKQWKIFEDEQYKIYKEKKTKKGFWDFLG